MTHRHGVAAVTTAVLAATAVLAVLAGAGDARHPASLVTSVPLALLLAWAGLQQVHIRRRGTTEANDLFEVVLLVCAIAFPVPVLVPLALLAKALSQAVERVEPRKAVFNAATAAATAAAMALVLQRLDDAPLLLALVLAHAASWSVNHLALLAVLTAAGVRRDVVDRDAVQRWAAQGVVSGVLGLLLALAWVQSQYAVLLFVVPLAALHHAGRSLNRATAERRRLAGTAAASRALSAGSAQDLPAYLDHLRSAYGAPAAYLRLGRDEPATTAGQIAEPVAGWLGVIDSALEGEQPQRFLLELPEKVEVLAVRMPGSSDGVLAVVDPRGERDSGTAELATISAAAREVRAFLDALQVRAEADQEHQRLEVVIRAVADGIVTVGPGGELLSFNPAAEAITGLAADGALRCHVDALALTTPDGAAWEPSFGTRIDNIRLQLRTASGQQREVDVSSSPAVVDGKDCVVLVLRDVSARVEQERARQRFVIGLGHELRTPLTPLLGWARTLRRRPELLTTEQGGHLMHALDTETSRLARLVDNLLTAVDPSSLISARTRVDLVELVQLHLRHARPELLGRAVTVSSSGSTVVTTSPRAVGQILDNLLSNVVRYTPAGSPLHIRISVANGAAVVELADRGPGVPTAQRDEIFGLFVRGDGDTANPGVGMGLAVSRSLARSLGGDLVCEPGGEPDADGEGPGAVFRLVLPVHVPPRRHDAVVTELFSS